MLTNRVSQEQPVVRERRGISIIEVLVAMTLLAFCLGSLGVLAAKTAGRARELDANSARTFVLTQQANRFSVLPYDSIPIYAPRLDTVVAGRFAFERRVSYTNATTGSEYRRVVVQLIPLANRRKLDSLVFERAKTYAKSPLFI
jgi:type II secretory pathway pseudopilin PulG